MKLKSLAFVLVVALMAGMAAPAMANPFADVPEDHWAYDAVSKLAAVGLVEGYPDGTYGGTRMMTRYEAAMVFARTLARLEALVEEQVAEETAGVRDEITADLMAEIERVKDELRDMIYAEIDKIEVPVVEVEPKEHIIERQPIERPFEMTPEAEAVISELVAELTKEYLEQAELEAKTIVEETKIIERVIDREPELTTEDIERLVEELLTQQLIRVHDQLEGIETTLADHEAQLEEALRQAMERDQRIEALEGDLAYVEHRVLGLIEGIRGDMEGLEANLMAEVDALAADMEAMSQEFETELYHMGVRVDALERGLSTLTGLVFEMEEQQELMAEEQAALREDHEELKTVVERVQFSGDLSFEGDYRDDDLVDTLFDEDEDAGFSASVSGMLEMTVKATETTDVRLWLDYTGEEEIFGGEWTPDTFGAEITSDTPMHRVVAGAWDDGEVQDFLTSYVMDDVDDYGLLGELKLGDVDAQIALSETQFGAAMQWAFMDVVGLQASAAAKNENIRQSAAMAGLFGDIAMFNYDVKFALDNDAVGDGDNYAIDATVGADIADVELTFNWVTMMENFGTGAVAGAPSFVQGDSDTKWQADAGAEFFGVDLAATLYNESERGADTNVTAYDFDAGAEFDFFLPLTLSGRIAGANNVVLDETEQTREAELGISGFDLFAGIQLSTSFGIHQNWLNDDFKVVGDYTGRDIGVIKAGLDYDFDWSGADVGLGYEFQFNLPLGDTADDYGNEMIHSVSADYAFSDDLSLNFDFSHFNQASPVEGEEASTSNKFGAGLSFSF